MRIITIHAELKSYTNQTPFRQHKLGWWNRNSSRLVEYKTETEITALTTERENVYNKPFSQTTPLPGEDLQVAVETKPYFQ